MNLPCAEPCDAVFDSASIVKGKCPGGCGVIERIERDPVHGFDRKKIEPIDVTSIIEQARFLEEEKFDFRSVTA